MGSEREPTPVDRPVDNYVEHLRWCLRRTRYAWDAETCWFWTASRNSDGYGVVRTGKQRWGTLAHRALYQMLVRTLDSVEQLDHLCGERSCVCPWHLDPVTKAERSRRRNRSTEQAQKAIEVLHSGLWINTFEIVETVRTAETINIAPQSIHNAASAPPAETPVTNLSTSPTTTKDLLRSENPATPKNAEPVDMYGPEHLEAVYREAYG